MTRSTASLGRRRPDYRFHGMKGFQEFLRRQCTITRCRTDVVRRRDLYRAYRRFCAAELHPVASVVNVGRYLGGLQVWASTRRGGSNGRRQEYAYVGLRLQELSPKAPQRGPPSPAALSPLNSAPPSPPTSSDDHLEDTDSPSPSLPSPGVSQLPREDGLELLDAFLREHVERTESEEDAVPVGELHAAYRRLCRARGVTPPPAATLSRCLARREGVVVSRLSFETVKRAYQGLRWTRAALAALTPSRRPRPTSCSSCDAARRSPAAAGGAVEGMKDEVGVGAGTSGGCSPWAWEDGLGDQLSLKYWDDEDTGGLLQTLQTASPPPQPTVISPSPPPDLMLLQGTVDLVHLLEAYNSTDPCVF